jgi:hypothetical protein
MLHNPSVFSARWTYSSKTSSFGGTSAQSYGIALFFAFLPDRISPSHFLYLMHSSK